MSDDEDPIGADGGHDNAGGFFGGDDDDEPMDGGAGDAEGGDDDDALDISGDRDDSQMVVGIGGDPLSTSSRAATERFTTRYSTKYERARVLGTRALQISMNAPVMVDLDKDMFDANGEPTIFAGRTRRRRKLPPQVRQAVDRVLRGLRRNSTKVWGGLKDHTIMMVREMKGIGDDIPSLVVSIQ